MIFKVFKSAKDLTGDKIRNPFFGTYILVWIIRNWDLIYTLIYFDEGTELSGRLECIQNYFKENDFTKGILNNLWITAVVLIISYLLLNISRFIVSYSELEIKPKIDKLTRCALIIE